MIGHKLSIVRGDCFNRVFDCSIRVYRSAKGREGRGPATPEFGHVTAWYTRVSTILKVLSLDFNTPLIIYVYITGAHDNLVDKRVFTTLLTQLKAAVLVKVLHQLFVEA